MGKKTPTAFRDAVISFLDQATRGYKTINCWLKGYVPPQDAEGAAFIRGFVADNNVPADLATRLGLTYVSEDVFDECLGWFISNCDLLPRRRDRLYVMHFSMSRARQVLGWKTNSPVDSSEAGGELSDNYGTIQFLGTALTFQSMEEYRWVSSMAYSTLGIRMNEKHLRPRKAVIG